MSVKDEIVEANEVQLVANEYSEATVPTSLVAHGLYHSVIKNAEGKLPD